jgi:hypothetical protein
MENQVTFGSDIEVFFRDNKGKSVSSQVLFPNHERIVTQYGIVERDGFAAELQPAFSTDIKVLKENTRQLLLELKNAMASKELEFDTRHVVEVDIPELLANGDNDSMIFGCKPDFSSYTDAPNTKPGAHSVNTRTCGGHIHFGLPEIHMTHKKFMGYDWYLPRNRKTHSLIQNTLRWMDILVGLPSVLIDTPSKRREVYGKAGDFRYTKFGAEYRSLSNFFLMSDKLFMWTFTQAAQAIVLRTITPEKELPADFIPAMIQAINTCNRELAQQLWSAVSAYSPTNNTFPALNPELNWF